MATMMLVPMAGDAPSLELAIAAWLHQKHALSQSVRTRRAYAETLADFRAALAAHGLDLDSPDTRKIALVAQAWSMRPRAKTGVPPEPATVRHRLAVVSSFYRFARRRDLLALPTDPIEAIERPRVEAYAKALPLSFATVAARLAAIDRGTPQGRRDYALLTLALSTGRRLAELAALTVGDIAAQGDGRLLVTWTRAKGGKVLHDLLESATATALAAWLADLPSLVSLTGEVTPATAVWRSLDHRRRSAVGTALTPRGIQWVCERRLGTGHVHRLRHTHAHAMDDAGAPLSEIQARLGHANIATTGRYVQRVKSAENRYAAAVAALLGIGGSEA